MLEGLYENICNLIISPAKDQFHFLVLDMFSYKMILSIDMFAFYNERLNFLPGKLLIDCFYNERLSVSMGLSCENPKYLKTFHS